MGIVKVKRAIIFLLIIGVMAVVAGCARWPHGPEPEPGETEYQLTITGEINEEGTINTDGGIYYIVLDADENPDTWPGEDIEGWEEDFYYVKLNEWGFYFAQKKYDLTQLSLESSSIEDKSFQVTIALSNLGDPNSIDINVITTDTESITIYDHLSSYFNINTNVLDSPVIKNDSLDDSGEGGPDFDIVSVKAEITTLY